MAADGDDDDDDDDDDGGRAVTRLRPEDLGSEPVSYAIRKEPPHEVWLNRIGVTGSLFSVGMGLALLLGRERR